MFFTDEQVGLLDKRYCSDLQNLWLADEGSESQKGTQE